MESVYIPDKDYIITDDRITAQQLAIDGYKVEILYICIKDET